MSSAPGWLVDRARQLDTRFRRYRAPAARHVVLDARTAMEYAMMAPVHQALTRDDRITVSLMSSERPDQVRRIFAAAPRGTPILTPRRGLLSKVDAYLASDFVWATLPRGAARVQMFHGVAGKWAQVYDRPDSSMRGWDRLFFINRRRLRNYIAAGAIDETSHAIRLIGMPKTDCIVDGTYNRDQVLRTHHLDPGRATVLYAPTWTPYSSLNAMGEEVIRLLTAAGFTVLVKLHENSLDTRHENSGGVDWAARLTPLLREGSGYLVRDSDISPWLVAADVLITDHSSVGFEYLLLDRPLVRIHMPDLIARAKVAQEYVDLMVAASLSAGDPAQVLHAVERGLSHPDHLSATRRAVAGDLFHQPGSATSRAVQELYELIELDSPAAAVAPRSAALAG